MAFSIFPLFACLWGTWCFVTKHEMMSVCLFKFQRKANLCVGKPACMEYNALLRMNPISLMRARWPFQKTA